MKIANILRKFGENRRNGEFITLVPEPQSRRSFAVVNELRRGMRESTLRGCPSLGGKKIKIEF
jgi:hypothetical protein